MGIAVAAAALHWLATSFPSVRCKTQFRISMPADLAAFLYPHVIAKRSELTKKNGSSCYVSSLNFTICLGFLKISYNFVKFSKFTFIKIKQQIMVHDIIIKGYLAHNSETCNSDLVHFYGDGMGNMRWL